MRPLSCILAFLVVFQGCSGVFFHPDRKIYGDPTVAGYQVTDLFLNDSEGPELHAWKIHTSSERIGRVIHLHGNAENITSHGINTVWLIEHGFDVYQLDYRGYGKSHGTPSMSGVHEDVFRFLDYLSQKEEAGCTVLLGQSLGATIALYVASQKGMEQIIDALVVESPFGSYRAIAREKLREFWITWPFSYVLGWSIDDSFRVDTLVSQIENIPQMYILTEGDEIVPEHHTKALYEVAGGLKTLIEVEGPLHLSGLRSEERRAEVVEWLNRICTERTH